MTETTYARIEADLAAARRLGDILTFAVLKVLLNLSQQNAQADGNRRVTEVHTQQAIAQYHRHVAEAKEIIISTGCDINNLDLVDSVDFAASIASNYLPKNEIKHLAEGAAGSTAEAHAISAENIECLTPVNADNYTNSQEILKALEEGTANINPVYGQFSQSSALDIIEAFEKTASVLGLKGSISAYAKLKSGRWLPAFTDQIYP